MKIPGISLITAFLAGALAAVIGVWLWLGRGTVRLKERKQLSLHRRLLFICATSFLSGVLVLALAEHVNASPWEKPLRDLAGAFLAAAIIGYIIELAEIRDFFRTLVTELVTGMGFLRTLSSKQLRRHAQLSLNERLGRTLGSREYANSLVQPILNAITPHLQSVFRENFSMMMKVHVLSTKEELAAALKTMWGRDVAIATMSGPVCMIDVTYCYDLLRRAEQQKPFKGGLWVECRTVGDVASELHAKCEVKIGGVPQEVALTSAKKGLLHQFSGDYEVAPGKRRIGVEVRTWQLDASRSTFTMQMISLTKGLSLTFSCKHDVYPTLDLFGLGGLKSNVRSEDPNVVTFAKPDFIMLPGHGFSVSWSPEGVTVPRSASVASRPGQTSSSQAVTAPTAPPAPAVSSAKQN